MAWIEIHQTLPNHRKTIEAATILGIRPAQMVGHLVCFWLWALDNAPDGKITSSRVSHRNGIVTVMSHWEGNEDEFVNALIEVKFLHEDGDTLIIHDWQDYAGKLIDARKANRDRQRRYRERKKKEEPEDENSNANITVTKELCNDSQYSTVQYSTVPNSTVPEDINTIVQKPKTEEPKNSKPPYQDIVDSYNSTCHDLPKVRALSDKRKRAINARWKEFPDINVFNDVFQKAQSSDFLSGRNGKWSACNFDWLLLPSKFLSTLEGTYCNKGGSAMPDNVRTALSLVEKYSREEGANDYQEGSCEVVGDDGFSLPEYEDYGTHD